MQNYKDHFCVSKFVIKFCIRFQQVNSQLAGWIYLSQIAVQREQAQASPQNSKMINQNTESLFCLSQNHELIQQQIYTSTLAKCQLENREIDLKSKNSFNLANSNADIQDEDTKETINSINNLTIKNFSYNSGICETENKSNTNETPNYQTSHSQVFKSEVFDSDQKQKIFIDDKEEESEDQDENQNKKSLNNSIYQKTEKNMLSIIKSSLHKRVTFQELNQKNEFESNEEAFKELLYLLQQNYGDKIKQLRNQFLTYSY
ncbi:hypothetical protein TTHERM_00740590 (macronuclear) [Tetrahymena thermophila SB210]|uniref:Uncharacterized protein n=1 Tax=Tetrahymena thermophila (strain SB210) TaxID=312017 RepID=Q239X3_TETTS|nr:hypothetical protein TTHERM_00740590 [Tetrahymena thermophila SB210]EAR93285.2 hypothetical protein TTHERM_00740590 [Tetrahymena thermophila SB210]|eukprot:XP_001013530.2 hypothetical protein TTHERM_00740590 [Tetrahymena thermophila SB210]